MDHTNVSLVLDNQAIYELCQKWIDIRRPSYDNLNHLSAKVISSMTSSLRFKSELNKFNSLTDFQKNLVPFPRLHFMITSMAPIRGRSYIESYRDDVQSLTEICFAAQNFFTKIIDFDPEDDKYMGISLNYHGDIKKKEAYSSWQWIKTNKSNIY